MNGGVIGTIVGGSAPGTSGNVSNNIITINGGEISTIYGAINADTATNNIVKIYNNPDLSNTNIFGSYGVANHSLNTLDIYTQNLKVRDIYYMDVMNFNLDENIPNGATMLTLTNGGINLSNTDVYAIMYGNSPLTTGNSVTLIHTDSGKITTSADKLHGKMADGVSLTYNINVTNDGQNVIATIGNVSSNNSNNDDDNTTTNDDNNIIIPPAPPSIPSSPLNSETDIIPIIPMPQPDIPDIPFEVFPEFDLNDEDKKDIGVEDTPEHKGWEIFADIGGGSMRYKTGNGHIDTTNQNANLGFARNVGNLANKLTIAPIIDYQNTNFDSYLRDGTHGRGNSKYTGGGFVLRNMNRNGFYYEGSFRAGKNKTDFASDNLDTTGLFGRVTYNNSATILNGHIKLGKYLRLNKNNLLDIYGFYYHTHQGGTSANLSSGEHYDFSSANAGKLRIGYRMTTRTSKISQVYTGLAYQYEHNSGITASYKGYNTADSGHNGSSGMLELGWIIKPLKENPWTVNINATGWIGNQRGVKAFAKVQKSF